MSSPALRSYRQFLIDHARPSSDLYALSDRVIARDVVEIVGIEGPLHADLLYQRMAKLYGIDRAGSEVRRVVDRALREATRTGEVVRRGRFYWPKGMDHAEPRTSGPRGVHQIAPEELHETILLVLRAQGPVSKEELIRATARALGFQRTGSSLTAGIGTAVDALVSAGRAARREGTVSPLL